MRLLLLSDTGDLSLTREFVGDDTIPPYAILSHTWGADVDEFSFADLTNGTGKNKLGYRKIHFCGEQARQDGLKYFWADTCCINKANYTELSYSINSMFRWYHNATQCYVYLADTGSPALCPDHGPDRPEWATEFANSRWFKRGWTLQELIAPQSVDFFSRQWERLGNKRSLRQQIQQITGIPEAALQNDPLSQFSVQERLSWTKNRQTKLEEDEAYSLLGIFNVSMALIYGEGKDRAFKRLQEEIDKSSTYQSNRHTQQSPQAAVASKDSTFSSFVANCTYLVKIFGTPMIIRFTWNLVAGSAMPELVFWSTIIASCMDSISVYHYKESMPLVLQGVRLWAFTIFGIAVVQFLL
jgi:hypothetical protein